MKVPPFKLSMVAILLFFLLILSGANAEAKCLRYERSRGKTFSYWINSCGNTVVVKWKDDGSCKPTKAKRFPCGLRIPPNNKVSTNPIRGLVIWNECEQKDDETVYMVENPRGHVYCSDRFLVR